MNTDGIDKDFDLCGTEDLRRPQVASRRPNFHGPIELPEAVKGLYDVLNIPTAIVQNLVGVVRRHLDTLDHEVFQLEGKDIFLRRVHVCFLNSTFISSRFVFAGSGTIPFRGRDFQFNQIGSDSLCRCVQGSSGRMTNIFVWRRRAQRVTK